MHTTTFEAKVRSILAEVMKINDGYCQSLELCHTHWALHRAVMENPEPDPWDGFWLPPDETVIGKPRLGTDPLPMLEEESVDDEDGAEDDDEPLKFESIEEAGKCFSRYRCGKWSW
jgi:hypothetical protein